MGMNSLRDAKLGSTSSPDVKMRLSIQRVQEEGTVVFNELSERLYTLEVQKADVDQELRRLQTQNSELEKELTNTRRKCEIFSKQLEANRKHSIVASEKPA